MNSVRSSPEVQRLLAASIVARLPQEMIGVGLLLQTQQLTGSFGQAGVVAGTYAIALGIGGPLLGQLVDRRGQTTVLLASATLGCALLITTAMLPRQAALGLIVLLAAGAGLATPPVGACLRAQLPTLLSGSGDARRAYALEASLVELTYIVGPPLSVSVAALRSGAAAVALSGAGLLVATAAFAGQPASRHGRPTPVNRRFRGSVLRPPAMRTLSIVLLAVGMLLGASEVAVIAAAKSLHSALGAAPLFALWGLGSFVGGLVVTRYGGPRRAAGLALLLGALTLGHLALIPADGSVIALGVVLFLAGTAIAPTESTLYAMVGQAAPVGTITEAFAWLATAMAVGGAVGSAAAGVLADLAGPAAAFALAGGGGALALLASLLSSRALPFPGRAPSERRRLDGEPRSGDRLPTTNLAAMTGAGS